MMRILWACIALFFVRVVGQIEVLLVEPTWLPGMDAWYSGLLPYPVLLPAQIALLMLMCGLAIQRSMAPAGQVETKPARLRILRTLAILYFVVMAVRLLACLYLYGGDFYLHGAIPIAFHWVLALFALTLLRRRDGLPVEPVDEPALHDEGYMAQRRWIRERVAFHCDDIGQAVRLYGAESVGGAD